MTVSSHISGISEIKITSETARYRLWNWNISDYVGAVRLGFRRPRPEAGPEIVDRANQQREYQAYNKVTVVLLHFTAFSL